LLFLIATPGARAEVVNLTVNGVVTKNHPTYGNMYVPAGEYSVTGEGMEVVSVGAIEVTLKKKVGQDWVKVDNNDPRIATKSGGNSGTWTAARIFNSAVALHVRNVK
jgi:hypothetical protein